MTTVHTARSLVNTAGAGTVPQDGDIPWERGPANNFLRLRSSDVEFGIASCSVLWSPLPHAAALGEWCFGGRTDEHGVQPGVRLEERRVACASEVERQEGCGDTAPEKREPSYLDSFQRTAVLGDAVEGSGRAAEHGPQFVCFSS